MKIAKLMAAAVAASMSVAPAVAAPTNPAASLSVANSIRAGSTISKSNGLTGVSTIPLIIGAVIVAGLAFLIIDDEDEVRDDADSN